jgi:hypothetical protein
MEEDQAHDSKDSKIQIPFPEALNRPRKKKPEPTAKTWLIVFKQVHINIPLLEAVEHNLACTKFLKELTTTKRRSKSNNPRKVILTEQASSIILNNLPSKKKDPGAPLISCSIGVITFDKALLDLGAFINLILTILYEKFGIGDLKPTNVTLQLVDRTTPSCVGFWRM